MSHDLNRRLTFGKCKVKFRKSAENTLPYSDLLVVQMAAMLTLAVGAIILSIDMIPVDVIQPSVASNLCLHVYTMKTHVRGFFDTDLHEVSWHFATHEAVRPSGF